MNKIFGLVASGKDFRKGNSPNAVKVIKRCTRF